VEQKSPEWGVDTTVGLQRTIEVTFRSMKVLTSIDGAVLHGVL
jgi:hypothetical protein